MQETQFWFLSQEDPLEEEMATHSSILAWKIPWTEEPGGLQSIGLQSQTQLSLHRHTSNNFIPIHLTNMGNVIIPSLCNLAYKYRINYKKKSLGGQISYVKCIYKGKFYRIRITQAETSVSAYLCSTQLWNSEGLPSLFHKNKSHMPWQWNESVTLVFINELSACECIPSLGWTQEFLSWQLFTLERSYQ